MKMKYVKPLISVERFGLTQSIALNCGVAPGGSTIGKHNHWDGEICTWQVGEITAFIESGTACAEGKVNEVVGMDDDFMGACYNNPNGNSSIFASY